MGGRKEEHNRKLGMSLKDRYEGLSCLRCYVKYFIHVKLMKSNNRAVKILL